MHYALAGEGIRNVSADKDLFLPTFFAHVQADGSRQRQAQSRFHHSDTRRSGCPSFDRKSIRVSAARSRRHHHFGRGSKRGPFGEESETPLVHAFYRLGQLSLPFLLVRFFARSSFCGYSLTSLFASDPKSKGEVDKTDDEKGHVRLVSFCLILGLCASNSAVFISFRPFDFPAKSFFV